MRAWHWRLALIGIAVLLTAGCASGAEWATWRQHPAHFASGGHLLFSLRNRGGVSPRVTRTDVAMARSEGWWGQPVTVSTDQILQK